MSLNTGSNNDSTQEIQNLIVTAQNLGVDDVLIEEALNNKIGGNHDSRKIIGLLKLIAENVSAGGGGGGGSSTSTIAWKPTVDASGNISWVRTASTTAIPTQNIKGAKGDSFTYDDFTPEQLSALKGEKGDAFTFSDFTPEQLASLKGEKGDSVSVSVMVNDTKYDPVNGVITLPNYPTGGGTNFKYSDQRPTEAGTNAEIVFNSSPQQGGFVGWVYTPLGWLGFGRIEGNSEEPDEPIIPQNTFTLSDGSQFLVRDENGNAVPFLFKV